MQTIFVLNGGCGMLRVLSSEIDLYPGSQEERLPGFSAQFPHITS